MVDDWLPQLSPRAQRLLAAERDDRHEDEGIKARAIERAQALLDGERWSGVNLRPGLERPLPGARSRVRPAALLAAASLALVGVAAAGLLLSNGPQPNTSAPPPLVTRAPLVTTRVESAPPPPRVAPEPAAVATAAPPVPQTAPAPTVGPRVRSIGVNQYAIELGLLEPARSHIARGDYNAALVAIAKHHKEYPNGQLAEEREALRVRALWSLGRGEGAEAAAAAFRKRYPRSALLSWMKRPAP